MNYDIRKFMQEANIIVEEIQDRNTFRDKIKHFNEFQELIKQVNYNLAWSQERKQLPL